MNIEELRDFCLSLPGTTESMKWGHLCFLIEEKIYVIIDFEGEGDFCVKCNPEEFDELIAQPGFLQAPHMAKRQWVLGKGIANFPEDLIKRLLQNSRILVIGKMSKKLQAKYLNG
ncbi:MAG: hypothetical protein EOO99_06780 [Pedobacter sp.]|nr:MAG: hypothetical protein EOO99_06780 [Pedobacter sp.]